jgi:hypothetical protein
MGKYDALGTHLRKQRKDRVSLSFDEIETILGFRLPNSARSYRAWWAEDPRHVQAFDGWMSTGWAVGSVDFSDETVEFVRSEGVEAPPQFVAPRTGPRSKSYEFEQISKRIMSRHLGAALKPGEIRGVRKLFDFVSEDGSIVGDAKYFTMVRGQSRPPAKLSVISEHVWLLENTKAKTKFLVFGNDRRVPELWLHDYGNMVKGVEFYFIDDNGKLEKLTGGEK